MRRVALSMGLAVALALAVAGMSPGAAPTPSHYLVRPDLRMCPSPTCGGAWVRRVNHTLTRCADGSLHAECYVASLTGAAQPPLRGRAGSFLGRGRLVPAEIDGFPGLGTFVAGATWRPAGPRQPRGKIYRVADNGVRCITSPCFTLTAIGLEASGRALLSDLDLTGVGATKADVGRAMAAIDGRGVLVTGTMRPVPHAGPAGTGRALVATQLWMPVGAV